jgi:hypothetical protein
MQRAGNADAKFGFVFGSGGCGGGVVGERWMESVRMEEREEGREERGRWAANNRDSFK